MTSEPTIHKWLCTDYDEEDDVFIMSKEPTESENKLIILSKVVYEYTLSKYDVNWDYINNVGWVDALHLPIGQITLRRAFE